MCLDGCTTNGNSLAGIGNLASFWPDTGLPAVHVKWGARVVCLLRAMTRRQGTAILESFFASVRFLTMSVSCGGV